MTRLKPVSAARGETQLGLLSNEEQFAPRLLRIEERLGEITLRLDRSNSEAQARHQAVQGLERLMHALLEESVQTRTSVNESLRRIDLTVTQIEPVIASLVEVTKALEQRTTQTQDSIVAFQSAQSNFANSAARHSKRFEELMNQQKDQLANLVQAEVATVTASRREMWAEAARFREQILRDLRWLIRVPMFVALAAILAFGLWILRRDSTSPPTPITRDETALSPAAPTSRSARPRR
jgi:hypothetical protein